MWSTGSELRPADGIRVHPPVLKAGGWQPSPFRLKRWTLRGLTLYGVAFSAMSESANTQLGKQFRPLDVEERIRLNQLEITIGKTVHSFLTCARALVEIRERQLWREKYQSFGDYAKLRWGICRSTADQLCRGATVYETLVQSTGAPGSDTPISETTPEVVLRPLCQLPGDELKAQTWRLAASVSPNKKPTRTIAVRVTRMVREAIGGKAKKNGHSPDIEPMFVRPIQRLARIDTFRADLAILHVTSSQQATQIIASCRLVAERCGAIEKLLNEKFA
jgi:hypothetical protein